MKKRNTLEIVGWPGGLTAIEQTSLWKAIEVNNFQEVAYEVI